MERRKQSEDVKHTSVTALNSDERNATQTADKEIHQTDFICRFTSVWLQLLKRRLINLENVSVSEDCYS